MTIATAGAVPGLFSGLRSGMMERTHGTTPPRHRFRHRRVQGDRHRARRRARRRGVGRIRDAPRSSRLERAGSRRLVGGAPRRAREARRKGRRPLARRRAFARRLHAQRRPARRGLEASPTHDHVDRPALDRRVRGSPPERRRRARLRALLPDARADLDATATDVAQGARTRRPRPHGARPLREGLRPPSPHGRSGHRPHRGAGHALLRHEAAGLGRGVRPDGGAPSRAAPAPPRADRPRGPRHAGGRRGDRPARRHARRVRNVRQRRRGLRRGRGGAGRPHPQARDRRQRERDDRGAAPAPEDAYLRARRAGDVVQRLRHERRRLVHAMAEGHLLRGEVGGFAACQWGFAPKWAFGPKST